MFYQHIEQRIAYKARAGKQSYLPRRHGKGKRTHQLTLLIAQLRYGQLGDKGEPLAVFHDTHKGFYAAQVVAFLASAGRFELAKLHELVPEKIGRASCRERA